MAEKEERETKANAEEGETGKSYTRIKTREQSERRLGRASNFQLMMFRKQHFSINFERKFSLGFLIYLYII